MLYSSLKRGEERGCGLLPCFKMNMGIFISSGVMTVLWREQKRLHSLFLKRNRQKMSTRTSMFLWLQDYVLFWTVRMINGYDHPVLNLKGSSVLNLRGNRNMSQVYKILDALDQGVPLDLSAGLGLP